MTAAAASRAAPPRTGLVGPGRAGGALAAGLAGRGYPVVGVVARSAGSRARAAAVLPGVPVVDLPALLDRADLVLLAVPDDELAAVASALAATGRVRRRHVVCHVSGAHGRAVLGPLAAAGATTLAVHPAMTFTGAPDDVRLLRDCAFAVTADAADRPFADRLVADLGGHPVVVAEADRPLYHAGLAHGANHLVTLVAQAVDLVGAAVPAGGAAALLGPLARAALDGALATGDGALTGPAARGDAGTLAGHRAALASYARRSAPDPVGAEVAAGTVSAYRALARATTVRAAAAGRLDAAAAARVLAVLAEEPAVPPAPARAARPPVARDRAELAAALAAAGRRPRVAVLTMGALHAGHAALLAAARRLAGSAGSVVATIFVNPLQFGPAEDLDRYPRTLAADLALCAAAGVDVVFAPSAATVYPRPPRVRLDPGELGAELEGAARPGHFAGVLTVVAKLLHLLAPDAAAFGEKDYQQLVLVRRMVADLDLPVAIHGVPIVREPDGLALSSRNRYLTPAGRARAAALPRALAAAAGTAPTTPDRALAAAADVLRAGAVDVDYLAVRDPELGPAAPGPARLLAAVRVDGVRLIDNVALRLAGTGGPEPGPA